MINPDRLWRRIMEVAQIGKEQSGGVTRVPFSPEDRQVKDLVARYMKEAGLSIREDAIGNLIGRKEGKQSEAPAVLMGSHLDTVKHGGNFDGVLGVIAGIEVLQAMKEHEVETFHPIEVIAFTGEDGARFSGLLGSRGFIGALTEEDLQQKDAQGITLSQAMEEAGFPPANLAGFSRAKESLKAYVELHIEQGKVLENEGLPVGVVDGIYGQLTDVFLLEGEGGHGGNTPVRLRKESLMAAAEIMLMIESHAREDGFRATISQVHVNSNGGIPRTAQFSLNLRAANDILRDGFEQQVIGQAERICERRGVKLSVVRRSQNSGALCDIAIQQAIKTSMYKAGLDFYSLSIGAGHDAMRIAELCPIGMIVVRSKDGVSHTPDEYSSPEDCSLGAAVLYHTILELAAQ